MKIIPLSQGKESIVDDEDFEWLSQWKWYANQHWNTSYAVRSTGHFPHQGKEKMHRLIMNAPDGMDVDHINGNGLDNRRANLRFCTPSQNARNKTTKSETGYKGVARNKKATRTKSFKASIWVNNESVYLGSFKTEIEAARAYDEAAKKYFRDFARLNFPEG